MIRTVALIAGVGVALWPLTSSAQEVGAGPGSPDSNRMVAAEQAYARANATAQNTVYETGDWVKAAELFVEAADLMPVDDPRWFVASLNAAQIYHSLGEDRKSTRILVNAGERAQQSGQIVRAAQGFGLAAGIFAQMGQGTEALVYVGRAQLLASSPHITPSERASILGRFTTNPDGTIQTVGR
jgi:hypothetical protein